MAIDYRGEKFSGYNKPKNDRTKTKKFSVLAKAKADKELWADVKMTLAVIGAVIGMCACIGGAIYYSQ